MIASFIRGLSVRDVEATLADALGMEATVSKSEVSRICQVIGDELDAWSTRRLDDVKLDYLFLDGSHFKYHVGAAAEPVLAAWGIDTDGNQSSSGFPRSVAASPATAGPTSSPTSASVAWRARCWSSPTARPG